jgi:hypothetical protein
VYEFDRTEPVTVVLQLGGGAADITAAEDARTVQVTVTPIEDTEAARTVAEQTQVQMEHDVLSVRVPKSGGWKWRRLPKVRVVVRVPAGGRLQAKAGSCDIRATGRYADTIINLGSGDGWVEHIAGDARLETASGDIGADRVDGALRIVSASGDIRVGDVTGDVAADCASGDITIRAAGGSLKAETASGDIEVGRITRGKAGLRSASGDVAVGVTAGTGVWLDLDTASGRTTSDLTMGEPADAGSPELPTVTLELRVRTASGNIHVRRVPVPATA